MHAYSDNQVEVDPSCRLLLRLRFAFKVQSGVKEGRIVGINDVLYIAGVVVLVIEVMS